MIQYLINVVLYIIIMMDLHSIVNLKIIHVKNPMYKMEKKNVKSVQVNLDIIYHLTNVV